LVSALLLQSNRKDDLEESGVVINSVDRMWARINGPVEVKSLCRVARLAEGKTVGKMMSMGQSKSKPPHLPITIDFDLHLA